LISSTGGQGPRINDPICPEITSRVVLYFHLNLYLISHSLSVRIIPIEQENGLPAVSVRRRNPSSIDREEVIVRDIGIPVHAGKQVK